MVEYEYAKALFDIALEEKKVELYLDYLNAVIDVTSSETEFIKLVASPLLDIEEKLKVISKVFQSFDQSFIEFLNILVKNQRFHTIQQIKEEYSKLFSEYNQILKVEVISSEILTKDRLKVVTKRLQQRYPEKKLIIENTVNPKILYGMQIICNGESIDISLKNMLNKMKETL